MTSVASQVAVLNFLLEAKMHRDVSSFFFVFGSILAAKFTALSNILWKTTLKIVEHGQLMEGVFILEFVCLSVCLQKILKNQNMRFRDDSDVNYVLKWS